MQINSNHDAKVTANASANKTSNKPTTKNGTSGKRQVPLNQRASGVLYEWKTRKPMPLPKKSTQTGIKVSFPEKTYETVRGSLLCKSLSFIIFILKLLKFSRIFFKNKKQVCGFGFEDDFFFFEVCLCFVAFC